MRRVPSTTTDPGDMSGLFDFSQYRREIPGTAVDQPTRAELRRLAHLFLVAAITLALFLLRAATFPLADTILPRPVYVVWGLAMLTGWAVTYVYAVFTTFRAQRWGWCALCAVPFTSVPAAVAYAWIRRREIERDVLGARH